MICKRLAPVRAAFTLCTACALLLTPPLSLRAETTSVPLADLGDLRIDFSPAESLSEIPGSALQGRIRYRSGEAFSVMLPMAAQRVEFLLPSGSAVHTGDGVVRLSGPDVHHWLLSCDATATQYEAAEARHGENRPLFERGALSAAAWAGIQRSYFDLQLENEHCQHVLELVIDGGAAMDAPAGEALTLGAPMAGFADFNARRAQFDVDTPLYRIIPRTALRLQADIPWRRSQDLVALALGECRVEVTIRERSSDGFFLSAWSDGLSGACLRPPGTVESVTPYYRRDALAVPRRAVFQWQQSAHVLIREGSTLVPIAVQLLGDDGDRFLIDAGTLKDGQPVLTESVSAVQGVLLRLGVDE